MSDVAAELEKVKKDVRSLLISAPNGKCFIVFYVIPVYSLYCTSVFNL